MAKNTLILGLSIAAALAAPAFARAPVVQPLPASASQEESKAKDEDARPITDKTVTAVDVIATPVSDLNLKKDKIPDVLLAAQAQPYDLSGLGSCKRLTGAIAELDGILGADLDLPQTDDDSASAGSIAKSAVGSFIPFRGLIREISGANSHERRLQSAIMAGSVRRGFLKGVGQQRGCAYPARAATPQVIAQQAALAPVTSQKPAKPKKKSKSTKVKFASTPVVQQTK